MRRSRQREWLYEGRELIHYEWRQADEYDAKVARERRVRMVKEAVAKQNLPADAFANDIEHDDDVGYYHPRVTEVATGGSTLREHGQSQKDF